MNQAIPDPRPLSGGGIAARGLRQRKSLPGQRQEKDSRPFLPGRRLPEPDRARLRELDGLQQPTWTDPDLELVTSARAGEVRAFEQLMRKYEQRVLKLVGRLVGEADAPDVSQDTFVKVHRALRSFRGQSAFYTWLYRIALNTAKNHLVSRRRRPTAQDVDINDVRLDRSDSYCHHETPEAVVEAWQTWKRLTSVMRKLPAEMHQAIVLREFDGMSYEEIANALDIPLGTVRSRLFRAREVVGSAMEGLVYA